MALAMRAGWVIEDASAREDLVPGSRYTSGRGAAMSDAFLPLGDDGASGLFYNPAILPRLKKPQFEAINMSMYANTDYMSIINYSSFFKVQGLEGFAPALQKDPG